MACALDSVLIIDAGSQYFKLIDRIIRGLCIKTVIAPLNVKHADINTSEYKAIVISGGPGSVLDSNNLPFDPKILELGIPVLGICFGMQIIVKLLGGSVEKLDRREDAQSVIRIVGNSRLFQNLDPEQQVLLTHGDSCTNIPSRFIVNAVSSENVAIAISDENSRIYGVQFHPEVNLTTNGSQIFKNFLFKIARINPSYTLDSRLETCVSEIKANVQEDSKIIILVSGGIDSTVCSVLFNKVLPNHTIYYVFVDHGYLRRGEVEEVINMFNDLGIKILVMNESLLFENSFTFLPDMNSDSELFHRVGPLKFTTNPEEKRSIIGDTFVTLLRNVVGQLDIPFEECIFVQGTLRPDLIEGACPSISSISDVIKTHHNDTRMMRFIREAGQIIEPFKDLHKDEIRQLATVLGLPSSIVHKQPFPGPGLAIRIICSESYPFYMNNDCKYDLEHLVEYIANFGNIKYGELNSVTKVISSVLSPGEIELLKKHTAKQKTIKTTILPILTVGVQGDNRSYKNVLALSSDDTHVDWNSYYFIAQIIPKICHTINRVVYCFGHAIRLPIHSLTTTFLTPDVVRLAREADFIVSSILKKEDVSNISQFPVVIIPVHFDNPLYPPCPSLRRSVVLRPFISSDFMTGVPAIPNVHIDESVVHSIVKTLKQLPNVSRVLYDLTCKPPGTTEWE